MCARKWTRVLRLTMSLTMTVPTTSPWSGCRVAVEEGLLGTDAPLLFRQLSTWAHSLTRHARLADSRPASASLSLPGLRGAKDPTTARVGGP